MTQALDELLDGDARARKISTNALIGIILTKYAEWDRFADRFGYVSVSRELFRRLLENSERDEIANISSELGARLPNELMNFWFKRANLDSILALISLYCTYGGAGQYELETDGSTYTVTAHHDLGEKWSLFLKGLFGRAMAELNIIPQFETTRDLIVMRFRA